MQMSSVLGYMGSTLTKTHFVFYKTVSTQEGSKPDCQTSLDLGIQASLTQRVFLLLWCFRGGSLKINTVPGLSYPMMRNP